MSSKPFHIPEGIMHREDDYDLTGYTPAADSLGARYISLLEETGIADNIKRAHTLLIRLYERDNGLLFSDFDVPMTDRQCIDMMFEMHPIRRMILGEETYEDEVPPIPEE